VPKASDIFSEGLERDIALKRANDASSPTGPLTAGMAVDLSTGALRAMRSGREGSVLTSPGPDYGRDLGSYPLIIDTPAIAGAATLSTPFDTPAWEWMLVTVQSDVNHADGMPMILQVYGLVSMLAFDLVFAMPLFGQHAIQNFVVPTKHDYHLIRILHPVGWAGGEAHVSIRRLSPGYVPGPTIIQTPILSSASITANNLMITHFYDRECRGFMLNIFVSAVQNPTTRVASIYIVPWNGNVGTPMWTVPLGIFAPVHTVARVPHQGPICIWWRTTGAVGPGWTVDMDFTPIYAA